MSEKAEFRVPDEVSSSADGNFLVDIVRVEDGRLMETLVLSEKTFPPRVNKKGKVLWQLPKAGVATLGAVEKERCMCMFRDLRKDRKKQRARVEEEEKKNRTGEVSEEKKGGQARNLQLIMRNWVLRLRFARWVELGRTQGKVRQYTKEQIWAWRPLQTLQKGDAYVDQLKQLGFGSIAAPAHVRAIAPAAAAASAPAATAPAPLSSAPAPYVPPSLRPRLVAGSPPPGMGMGSLPPTNGGSGMGPPPPPTSNASGMGGSGNGGSGMGHTRDDDGMTLVSKPKKLSRGPPAVSTPAVNPLAVNTRGRDLVGAANTLANTPNTPANTPGNPLEMRAKETWKAEWKSSFLSRLEEKAEKAWEEHLDAGAYIML
mmetsp:Transcript_21083/g.46839  ORF Transcript_21083/g.46839 Transcript_21083/m.46839 type:complete len:371 (+) Transcript_21083:118-1230(+)|eukprot:CAMPEP_0173192836 /NCGR_PEP_ID=MMETSP1141-20130122/13632_1 /TAXON_ID=483371 /ORGANISM="non described non described, Strain CCMP2298" /LENGTH=370 /DNA_ID=CAMNT_0014117121 /DNA_START=20 /DNA_END=1132 /DNA_ORIENTATION=+